VLALNCGHAVNPQQIAAQVEGSVAYGLTAALYGECPVENGRMASQNFNTYEIMRLAEMPKVETVIVPTFDFWGGVGEPTICVVTPSVLMRSTPRPASRCAACAEEREARVEGRPRASEDRFLRPQH
jgi:CO/xanthine dehydrogenase Mo-binding subunit